MSEATSRETRSVERANAAGYICAECGLFVSMGSYHACAALGGLVTDPIAQNTNALHRLANAIDRLTEALAGRAAVTTQTDSPAAGGVGR